jgi:hypothetical protein
METPTELDPAHLPPGTKVGPWRVVSKKAQGTYGTVYRAVSSGQDEPVPVALKLARHPEDPRFSREATLLSRLDHPSIPLVLDHGRWRSPSGAAYPYLTMAWVEGTPLYEWAREHAPTSRQVLGLLAHLARALQATHRAGGVHRDVKGDNVLVRHEDTRAVLTDFGSANHRGAVRLTWRTQPPGTPAYRSPEAWRFLLRFGLASDAHYLAAPADDLFALGVTAYRLVTGQYPPSPEPGQPEALAWEPEGSGPRPPHELNPRVEPGLGALILRMLSVSPEARGTAKDLAEALELAAQGAAPGLDQPLFQQAPPPPADQKAPGKRVGTPARALRWMLWLAPVTGGVLLAIWAWPAVSTRIERLSARAQATQAAEGRDAGTVAVGDTSAKAASRSSEASSEKEPVASDVPEKTFPGQVQPDAKGRCPRPGHVVINGLCWATHPVNAQECEGSGYVYVQGKCYAPVFSTRKKPTSNPSDSR